MQVKVRIIYHGRYKQTAKRSEQEVKTDAEIGKAYEFIKTYLKEKHRITPPYNLLIKGCISRARSKGV